jgi:hypothetical protein
MVDAYAAAHALGLFNASDFIQSDRVERARRLTSAAAQANLLCDLRDVTRRRHHRDPEIHHGVDATATAFAAVADGEETIQTTMLEPSDVNVAALMFGFE